MRCREGGGGAVIRRESQTERLRGVGRAREGSSGRGRSGGARDDGISSLTDEPFSIGMDLCKWNGTELNTF